MTKLSDRGLNFKKLFWIFIIGSIIGAYYEEILFIIKYYISNNSFKWEPRRGMFWGPFSPIYGMGAVLMSIVLVGKNNKWYTTFILSMILGGLTEYIIGFLQETFLGTTSWNYSNMILNINGRTSVPIMIIWGFMGLVFLYFIYPIMSKLIDKIKGRKGEIITNVFICLITVDIFISWGALIRQSLRHHDIPAYTIVGKWFDDTFTDEYIQAKMPNTVRSK